MARDISYVIAAYNAQATIALAIDSVLGQQGVDVEVIVADDCSSDQTASIVRSYPSDKVRLVSLACNAGPGGARNAGIAKAAGRWVGIIDADDEILPSRTRRLLERASSAHADCIVDNVMIRTQHGERLLHRTGDLARLEELSLSHFIDHNMLFGGRFNLGYLKPVIRRDFLAAHTIAYDERLRIGEDYLLLAHALVHGARCVVEPEAGYVYNSAEGSISHIMTRTHVEAMLKADREFTTSFPLQGSALQAQQRRTKNLADALAYLELVDHIKQRSISKAIKDVLRNPAAARHLRMPIAVRVKSAMAALQTPMSAVREVSE
jgi:succinoglycan biosynthesis protein ExoO